MSSIDTITLLNRLIVTSKNGEAALRAAADEAHHPEIRDSLTEYSRFFADAARELQDAVLELGGRPKGTGTFDNTLHRAWLHIKASAYGRNEAVILDEVESDEQEAEIRFAEALTWQTSPQIHGLLERQYEGVHARHSAIRQMREHLGTDA
ncbi:MAG: PA2169 family four-helix-bundle protein [Nevskia sp.]